MEWRAVRSPDNPDLFAVARQGPGVQPTVECDGFGTEQEARRHARELARDYQRRQARLAQAAVSQYDRRIPAGFYTEKDAS